ncbi:MAG: DUF4416 family protein [Fibrobacterota bacterium]
MTPTTIKTIAAVLTPDQAALEKALAELAPLFGPTDFTGPLLPFDVTDYYEKEMGGPLFRSIVSFTNPGDAGDLACHKRKTMSVEASLRNGSGGRLVNIDTGYLDFDRMVLASVKPGPYKVYMADGIWADLTLHYEKGAFHPMPWTFADFKDGRYNKAFMRIRELFKKQA